jgi:hypothetical protein
MRDDSPENDPRTIWQNQPTEPSTMTLEKIRQKVRELHVKTRRQLLGSLAEPIIVVAFCGFAIKQFHDPMLGSLFVFPFAWSLAGLYFLNQGMWSAAMPGDAALSTGLEFYRREIERRRYLFRRLLLWSFGPVLLTIGTFILVLAIGVGNRGIFPNAMPFMSLVVIWIAAYFVIRMREQRELKREIAELNDIERQNRG